MDIVQTQAELADIDKKIEAEREKFEQAVAFLRDQSKELRREYKAFLLHELASIDGSKGAPEARRRRGSVKIDDEAIVGHLRRAQIEQSATDIKEAIDYDGPSNPLSAALKRLSEVGRIVKEGEGRATRYRIH